MQSRFLFVSTSTFFNFLISHAYFRVFCWFRCSFLLRCLPPQNMSLFRWQSRIFWTSQRLEKRLTKWNIRSKKYVKYLYNTRFIIHIFTTNLHLRHKYARNERLSYVFVSQLVTIIFRKLTSICQTFKAQKHWLYALIYML